jgi:hypothetical protein
MADVIRGNTRPPGWLGLSWALLPLHPHSSARSTPPASGRGLHRKILDDITSPAAVQRPVSYSPDPNLNLEPAFRNPAVPAQDDVHAVAVAVAACAPSVAPGSLPLLSVQCSIALLTVIRPQ